MKTGVALLEDRVELLKKRSSEITNLTGKSFIASVGGLFGLLEIIQDDLLTILKSQFSEREIEIIEKEQWRLNELSFLGSGIFGKLLKPKPTRRIVERAGRRLEIVK